MRRQDLIGSDIARLLPYALLATATVIVLPVLIGVFAVKIGEPHISPLLASALGATLACGLAVAGSAMWLRRPESIDVNFGELMLWRWHRRKRAEATIAQGAGVLGLVKGATPVGELDPVRKLQVLESLTGALEAKDPYTLGHSRRVARHVYRTAIALGLTGHEIDQLRRAATLHDVGKIRIPDRVLRKPGRLSDDERDIIMEHSTLGAEMVTGAAPKSVALAIKHHHERWDGTGYPERLRGAEIPLFSRIICVADAYDAMTSARPYKPGCDRKTAVESLRSNAGIQFDPEVVEAFIKTLPAALPAAGALLLLAGPAPLLRKVSTWFKTNGAGSVATAAGATSAAIIVAGAGITGVGLHHKRQVPLPAAQAQTVVAESANADYNLNKVARLAVSLADSQASTNDARVKKAEKRAAAKAAASKHKGGSRKHHGAGATTAVASAAAHAGSGGHAGTHHGTSHHGPRGDGDHTGSHRGDGSKGSQNATDEVHMSNGTYDPHP
ncbi:MAG: hypothetical protein QOK47_653, partial [Actinomycetota bacterium]|nr:hypothetical protein [Actinomycetota bacterium]